MKKNHSVSLIKNILYNVVSQVVILLVPLITAPYISRIFNAELIGEYSYALANSTYFVLLENLGFNLYGQLKVAKYRDDIKKLSKFYFEIMALKLILCAISIFAYCFLVLPVSKGISRWLCLVMIINIVAEAFDITWFYNGLELFKYTAIRNVLIRLFCLISVLLLVKDESDIVLYAIIMQGATFASGMVMFFGSLKRVSRKGLEKINVFQHILPAWVYFIPSLVTTIFSSADKTMLGVFTNVYEVGVYEQAHKISQICMNAISAVGNAILPRAANINNESNSAITASKKLLKQSLNIVMFIAMPITFGIYAISDTFIPIFFGEGYEKSIVLVEILSLNVLITAIGNLVGQQCLIAKGKQKEYNIVIIISALSNVFLNYFLIKSSASVGASIATVISSFVIVLLVVLKSNSMFSWRDLLKNGGQFIFAAIIMLVVVKCLGLIIGENLIGLLSSVIAGAIVYLIILLLLKNELLKDLKSIIMGMSGLLWRKRKSSDI